VTIRVPVTLDVTDNDIAESIEDEVDTGARRARSSRAGNIIGRALGIGIGDGVRDGISLGVARGTGGLNLSGILRGVTASASQEGDNAGRGFGDGFSRGLSSAQPGIQTFGQLSFSLAQVAAGATAAVSAVTPLGGALGGVVAGAVAVAGAVGQAAGAAVSAAGVLASLGLAAVTARVASAGLSDAFAAQSAAQEELASTGAISESTQQALTAAMQGLAPAAAAVVTEVSALTPAWSAFQDSIQQTVFADVAGQLRGISDAILPTLQSQLGTTAGVLNQAIQGFAQFAQSEQTVSHLDTILSGLNATLTALLPGAGAVGQGLLAIFAGAGGPATDMATAISNIGLSFGTWAQGVAESGQLTTFLEQANVVLGDLLGIVGNVGSILVSVFGAGAATGGDLLSILRDATGQLAAFLQTAGAQAGLQQFFGLVSQVGSTISDLGGIIGPIFAGVFAVLGELTPHINALREALLPVAQVVAENLGVALTGLAPVIGVVASLIVLLVQALAPLVQALVGALGPAIAQIGALFTQYLAPAIATLIPVLQPILDWFFGVFAAQIQNAVNFIVTVLEGAFQIIGGLVEFVAGVLTGDWERAWGGIQGIVDGVVTIVSGLITYLVSIVKSLFESLRPVFAAVGQWFEDLGRRFQLAWNLTTALFRVGVTVIVGAFQLLRDRVFEAVQAVITRVVTGFSGMVNNVASFIGNLVGFVAGLPGRIVAAVGDLGALLYQAGRNVIQGLINGITSMIGRVGSSMASIAAKIRSYLPFSPAKEGPLSGQGNPEESGRTIVEMLSSGIDSRSALPASAMNELLRPLAPAGRSRTPAAAPAAAVAGSAVEINQNFFGPTTSGGRLQEMNWTARYATQARTETVGGVAT
jgi:phage-related protein